MGNDVLTHEDLEFIAENSDQIKQFANEEFAGVIELDERHKYELITLKLGRMYNICWSCGGDLKRIGKQLQQWL